MSATMYQPTNTASTSVYTSATSNTIWFTNSTASTTTSMPVLVSGLGAGHGLGREINLNDGRPHTIKFPDGTIIEVKANGSFEIFDDDAKVIYAANRSRDFNPFLNASDKLEDFIRFCGEAGVRQGDVLGIPIKHFIGWLIVEAARADGEPAPKVALLPDLRKAARPHCRTCGRFISPRLPAQKIEFCRPRCFETALGRLT